MREPSKLRSWLCAILRFRISKQFCRQTREPVHSAESIAATDKLYRENFASLPHKTLVRIDSSYHFMMLDQPDQFAKQADVFLK